MPLLMVLTDYIKRTIRTIAELQHCRNFTQHPAGPLEGLLFLRTPRPTLILIILVVVTVLPLLVSFVNYKVSSSSLSQGSLNPGAPVVLARETEPGWSPATMGKRLFLSCLTGLFLVHFLHQDLYIYQLGWLLDWKDFAGVIKSHVLRSNGI